MAGRVRTKGGSSGSGSGGPPRLWDGTPDTFLRWDMTDVVGVGALPDTVGPATLVSEGSNTLALTPQAPGLGGKGCRVNPSTLWGGNAGYMQGGAPPAGNVYGWQGGAGSGAHPAANSPITFWNFYKFIAQSTSGNDSIYFEKAYYVNDANVAPFITFQIAMQRAGVNDFNISLTTADAALHTLTVPFPFLMNNGSGGAMVPPGYGILLAGRYSPASGQFDALVNGAVWKSANLGAGLNVGYGTDGDYLAMGSVPRAGGGFEPRDELLAWGLEGRAVPDKELKQWWQIANFGASSP